MGEGGAPELGVCALTAASSKDETATETDGLGSAQRTDVKQKETFMEKRIKRIFSKLDNSEVQTLRNAVPASKYNPAGSTAARRPELLSSDPGVPPTPPPVCLLIASAAGSLQRLI